MTDILLTAIALVLIIEGTGPALFPNRWRSYLLRIAKEPATSLRTIGMVMLLLGSVLLVLK
ncbi:MAG: DUF2065 domain-containing protein [Colwellia sp.]|nr:DUF2065 domain-containing protein [Colwellia sp.]MCW8864199.1 DUF2065 domain-containing protein [Colwellia sp.]MCW9082539.1 DUF2065 domain-containing protein [Colwellia sp.]